jgi:hypothetical protein
LQSYPLILSEIEAIKKLPIKYLICSAGTAAIELLMNVPVFVLNKDLQALDYVTIGIIDTAFTIWGIYCAKLGFSKTTVSERLENWIVSHVERDATDQINLEEDLELLHFIESHLV